MTAMICIEIHMKYPRTQSSSIALQEKSHAVEIYEGIQAPLRMISTYERKGPGNLGPI